jgi:hypothetical protein
MGVLCLSPVPSGNFTWPTGMIRGQGPEESLVGAHSVLIGRLDAGSPRYFWLIAMLQRDNDKSVTRPERLVYTIEAS